MPWERLVIENRPFLRPTDTIFTCREYISGGGYQAGCNNTILNLKISPDQAHRIHYKNRAINTFAQELAQFFGNIQQFLDGITVRELAQWRLTAIPPSKHETHPLYDDRIRRVCRQCCRICRSVVYADVITALDTRQSFHEGSHRNPALLAQNFSDPVNLANVNGVFVVDDVITQGTNFRAFSDKVHATNPRLPIIGVIWARTVWPEPDFEAIFGN